MEPSSTWEAFQYALKAKKEITSFISKYNLKKVNPILYLPLHENFTNIVGDETYTYPYMKFHEEIVESIEFRKDGFYFSGTNMVGVYNKNIPAGSEPRSFMFGVKVTSYPKQDKPMFFFSYGKREHDKAFGLFWGLPQVEGKDGFLDSTRKAGLKAFTYCAIPEKDRTSTICDIDIPHDMVVSEEWIILAMTYDGKKLRIFINGKESISINILLDTFKAQYLNIGGFLHHTEDGKLLPKDMEYSMKGYIREFMMFDRKLTIEEIENMTKFISNMIKK